MNVISEKFGESNEQTIQKFILTNDQGISVSCLDYGCIITDILIPDRNGKIENVVLGFDSMEDYQEHSPYFGAIVGRVAGRIKGGQFELNGNKYILEKNEGANHLHGGAKGFSNVIWDASILDGEEGIGVEFSYLSVDGEEGYPGNLQMKVTYLLTNNEFTIIVNGTSDQDTLLNVTNHTYFNLSGNIKDDVLKHQLTLKSDRFLELNEELLPTGEMAKVEGTVFDFQAGRKIEDGTVSVDKQNLLVGGGYDHPFLLSSNNNKEIQLYDEVSGRNLTVETNQPAVVVYTSNQLEGDFEMRGVRPRNYLGICLETQGLPDAIHHPQFPSVVLKKGKEYKTVTTYRFGVEK